MKNWNSKLLEQLLLVQETDLKIRSLDLQIQLYHQRSKEEDGELSRIKTDIVRIDEALSNTESQNQMYATTLEDIRSAIKGLLTTKAGVPKPRTRSSTEALKIEEEKLESLVEETAEQLIRLKDERDVLLVKAEARNVELESDNEGPEAEIRKLQQQIQTLEQQRASEVEGLPSLLLKHYDRLRSSRSGIGLTIIRDGVCTVCCMQMPTSIISKLAHGEKIDMCPACGRMVARIEHLPPSTEDGADGLAVEDRPSRKLRRVKPGKPMPSARETQDERKAALKKTLKKKIAGLDAARSEEEASFEQKAESKKSVSGKRSKASISAESISPEDLSLVPEWDLAEESVTRAAGKARAAEKVSKSASEAPAPLEAPVEVRDRKKTSKSAAKKTESDNVSSKKKADKKQESKQEPRKAEVKKAEPKKAAPKKTEQKKAEPKKGELKKAASKKDEAQKAAPKKAETKKAEVKKAEAKKAEPKKAAAVKQSSPKGSQKKAKKQPEPKKAPPKKTASKKPAKSPSSKKK